MPSVFGFKALFISAALIAAATAAPALPDTPAAEIAAMDSLLNEADQALQTRDSLEPFLYTTSSLASRLDTFEMQFGVQPDKIPEWQALSAHARKLLKRVDGKHRNAIYFNADSAETGTCVLMEISGRSQDALKRLNQVQPGGGCGNWAASVMLAVNQQKSGIYQRSGDYVQALASMEEAEANVGIALGVPNPDLLHCRHAFLLGKNGRTKEATNLYQQVVDLYPQTIGEKIARRTLTQSQTLIEPDLERISTLYANRDPEAAIFAIGIHRFPGSFDYLVQKLKTEEPWMRNRIIPALGLTEDSRAVPILQEIVEHDSDQPNTLHALAALGKLGDHSKVISCLRRWAKNTDDGIFTEGYWLDDILRGIYHDGPAVLKSSERFEVKNSEVALKWLRWLEATKSDRKDT